MAGSGPGRAAGRGDPARVRRNVTLTVPEATLTGRADRPGELGGIGPIDPNPGANTPGRYQIVT